MAQPSLKSIHPVNLLSFGPKTEPIELRPLNILIGPNGSGKSNLIEVIRLLHVLPDKDPWSSVLATGGVGGWLWKGRKEKGSECKLTGYFSLQGTDAEIKEDLSFSIVLDVSGASFRVKTERLGILGKGYGIDRDRIWLERNGSELAVYQKQARERRQHDSLRSKETSFGNDLSRSIFSQLASPSLQTYSLSRDFPEVFKTAEFLESFDFHQSWEFGVDCPARKQQPVGQPIDRLRHGGLNLAQMLAYYRDNYKAVFEQLTDLARRFYEPIKSIEIRLISYDLQIAIEEEGGFSTPATRLSDGMLRWLALLCILLNPTPPPVTCIDEPELGFHPDIIPTLADLLRDAATRTQLIVTTHSSVLVDAFSDDPESICVCEKVDGSTVIRRLSEPELNVWLKDYSLGNLWISGQIGGDRW
jgi:predicted ATPase